MPTTSSMQRLWLAALCLLAAAPGAAEEQGAEVKLTWKCFDYEGSILTQQDRLEVIRSAFSPLKAVRRTYAAPMTESGMDIELTSLLALTTKPAYFMLAGSYSIQILTSSQAIRRFEFDPTQHTGWITLADEQPPLVTTKYHQMVIRMLQTYAAWKSEADARLLKSLNGPGDPGFFAVIEWELGRSGGEREWP